MEYCYLKNLTTKDTKDTKQKSETESSDFCDKAFVPELELFMIFLVSFVSLVVKNLILSSRVPARQAPRGPPERALQQVELWGPGVLR